MALKELGEAAPWLVAMPTMLTTGMVAGAWLSGGVPRYILTAWVLACLFWGTLEAVIAVIIMREDIADGIERCLAAIAAWRPIRVAKVVTVRTTAAVAAPFMTPR